MHITTAARPPLHPHHTTAASPERIERLLARAGTSRDSFSMATSRPSEADALLPPRPPATVLDEEAAAGAQSFAAQLETVLTEKRGIHNLNADALLAAFLKLNICDPNNTVETQNRLHELASNLREMALREAQKRQEVAAELAREAEDAGGYAAMAMQVAALAGIAGIFTGGILSMLAPALQAGATVGKAVEDHELTAKMLDAQDQRLLADRSRNHADRHQDQIENEAESIRTLFEYKNQVVDRVLQMMDQNHATRNRVMSVTFAY